MNTDIDNLYMDVLNGRRVMVDKWHGMWSSPDGEFIRVQGSGSWAFRSDDKERFYEELEGLVNNHAQGDDSKIKVKLWDF